MLLLSVGNSLVMWSERTVPSGIAALIVATVPVWILLLDGLRPGGRPWTARVWVGTAIGLAGVVLVARPEGDVDAAHWLAIVALQVACLSWTIGSLYAQSVREAAARSPRPPPSRCWPAGALILVGSRARRRGLVTAGRGVARAWGALVYLVVFGSLVGFTAFAYCLNELPASTVGTYAYVNPVVAVRPRRARPARAAHARPRSGGGALIVLSVVLTTLRHARDGSSGRAPSASRAGSSRRRRRKAAASCAQPAASRFGETPDSIAWRMRSVPHRMSNGRLTLLVLVGRIAPREARGVLAPRVVDQQQVGEEGGEAARGR